MAAALLGLGARDPRTRIDYGATASPMPVARPLGIPPITTSNGVPDTASVNAAATTANQQNSQYNNAVTHGNTTTPLGSQTYTSHVDPRTGAIVYDTNVSLAPDQQKLLDLQNQQSLALGKVGTGLLGDIGKSYGTPVPTNPYSWSDFNTERQRVEDSLYKQNTQYLDPQFAQKKEQLSQQLASQGITAGSDAWRTAMDQYSRDSQSAYGDARQSAISGSGNEATLMGNAGHQQLVDALTSRNEPLNEYSAIRGASPVNIPQFNPAQTPLAANVDVAGNAFHSADENLQQQAIKAGNRNAVTSGLFGLGADVLGSKWGGDLISGGLSKLGGYLGLGSPAAATTATAAPAAATAASAAAPAAAAATSAAAPAAAEAASTFTPSAGIPFSGPASLADTAAYNPATLEAASNPSAAATGSAAGTAAAAAIPLAITYAALTQAPYRVQADWWNKLSSQLTSGKTGNATYDANTPPAEVQYNAKVALYRLLSSQGADKAIVGGSNGASIPDAFKEKARAYGMLNADGSVNPNWNPGADPKEAAMRQASGYVMYNGHWVPGRGVGGGGGGQY